MWRIADGKIVEHWYEADNLGMMQQLGVVPTPEHAADQGVAAHRRRALRLSGRLLKRRRGSVLARR
jgi:hypothetical protein